MLIRLSNIFFYGLLILLPNFNTVASYGNKERQYFQYLISVTQHFRYQTGWYSMQNLKVVDDKHEVYLNIEELFQGSLSDHIKLINMYNKIAELINYRYAEIVKKFLVQLTDVTNECNNFYHPNSLEQFFYCIMSLQDIVKYSKTLFENLYSALTFLSCIDVKIVCSRYQNYSHYIVDELYDIKNFVSSVEKVDFSTYTNDKMKLIEKAHNFVQAVSNFGLITMSKLVAIRLENGSVKEIFSTIEIDLKRKYEHRFLNEHPNFVSFMSAKLKMFIDATITNDFVGLGFSELMNPTSPKLFSPHKNDSNQDYKIRILNFLFQHRGWENLNHIGILYNDHTITASRVVRDMVNYYNYPLKKDHLVLLLKCMCTEILKNFDTILSSMLNKCSEEGIDGDPQSYYNCLVDFSNIIYQSQPMFENLLDATKKLERLAFWDDNRRHNISLTRIKDTIQQFLDLLEKNNSIKLKSSQNLDTSTNLAVEYQNEFEMLRAPFLMNLHAEFKHRNRRCTFKFPFLTNHSVEQFFNNNPDVYKINRPFDTLYRELFLQFVKYCENVNRKNYYALGFQNI